MLTNIRAVSMSVGGISGLVFYQGVLRTLVKHRELFKDARWYGTSAGSMVGFQFRWICAQVDPDACWARYEARLMKYATSRTGDDFDISDLLKITLSTKDMTNEQIQERIKTQLNSYCVADLTTFQWFGCPKPFHVSRFDSIQDVHEAIKTSSHYSSLNGLIRTLSFGTCSIEPDAPEARQSVFVRYKNRLCTDGGLVEPQPEYNPCRRKPRKADVLYITALPNATEKDIYPDRNIGFECELAIWLSKPNVKISRKEITKALELGASQTEKWIQKWIQGQQT